jgi:large subunit ribosomal protein L9
MPEAILLKDVDNLGARGAVVDVSKGYLRNFLIPRKLAQPATKASIVAAQQKAVSDARVAEQQTVRSRELAEQLAKTVLTLSEKAGEDGRLFGSVTTQDIADAIKEARGVDVDKRHIHLDEPIKNIGTYMVVVELESGVTATVKTLVTELQ